MTVLCNRHGQCPYIAVAEVQLSRNAGILDLLPLTYSLFPGCLDDAREKMDRHCQGERIHSHRLRCAAIHRTYCTGRSIMISGLHLRRQAVYAPACVSRPTMLAHIVGDGI